MPAHEGGPATNEFAVEMPWTWRERLWHRLLPSLPCPLPSAPAHFADCVVVRTVASLSLLDRVRVLLTGCLTVETRTVTENIVGATVTNSVAYPTRAPKRLTERAKGGA